jgi:hypothetical protein
MVGPDPNPKPDAKAEVPAVVSAVVAAATAAAPAATAAAGGSAAGTSAVLTPLFGSGALSAAVLAWLAGGLPSLGHLLAARYRVRIREQIHPSCWLPG